jgi:hypothetical protein
MRLSDAGLQQRQSKAPYPNHQFPPWLNEDTAPRSLESIVRGLTHSYQRLASGKHRRTEAATPTITVAQDNTRCAAS